jgi:hypothetical protein
MFQHPTSSTTASHHQQSLAISSHLSSKLRLNQSCRVPCGPRVKEMAHKGFHFSICSCRCPKNVDHVANNGLQIWPQGWSEIRPPLKGFCTQLKLLKPWMCWMWISDLFHCFILAAALSHLSTGRSPASGNLANDG